MWSVANKGTIYEAPIHVLHEANIHSHCLNKTSFFCFLAEASLMAAELGKSKSFICDIKILMSHLVISFPPDVRVWLLNLSQVMRKQTFCICENKGADRLRSNCEADQRLCFRYMDSTISLLSKSKSSSL